MSRGAQSRLPAPLDCTEGALLRAGSSGAETGFVFWHASRVLSPLGFGGLCLERPPLADLVLIQTGEHGDAQLQPYEWIAAGKKGQPDPN
jgi:hypothetical protein